MGIARRAGTARHQHDAIDAHQARELDRLARHRVVAPSRLARMKRIAGAIERADRDPVRIETRPEFTPRAFAFEHPVEPDVRRRRPVAAGELELVHVGATRAARRVSRRRSAGRHRGR